MKVPLKKFLTVVLSVATVLSAIPAFSVADNTPVQPSQTYKSNVLPENASVFDSANTISDTFWTGKYGSPTVSLTNDGAGGQCLKVILPENAQTAAYSSAAINLANYIKEAGTYRVAFDYKITSSCDIKPFKVLLRTDKVYSFSKQIGSNIYGELGETGLSANGVWYSTEYSFTVAADDIKEKSSGSKWDLCLHLIQPEVSEIYIDNVIVASTVSENLIPDNASNFDSALSVTDTGWSTIYNDSGKITNSLVANGDGKCLYSQRADGTVAWASASFNFAPYVTRAGKYRISFEYKVDYKENSSQTGTPFYGVIRADKNYSFTNQSSYRGLDKAEAVSSGEWGEYSVEFTVTQSDIDSKGTWNLALHQINENITGIYLDNVTVRMIEDDSTLDKEVTRATVWMKNEAVFVSEKTYTDPYNDVTLDIILTNGETTYTIPAFWDGGNIWRARFVCTSVGEWTYTTQCSDVENTKLHDRTSKVYCTEYSGDKDIYKHGFVKTGENRYFTYADGTPFFYLGDTHWGFGGETDEIAETVVKQRAEQGFTVLQSEPLGASFNLTNGVTQADMDGFADFDGKFEIVAACGLVHANAEFFFPSSMKTFILNHGGWTDTPLGDDENICDLTQEAKDALARLTRYWVARYSAYPVMWTLGQEVDNDFYWERDNNEGHAEWNYINNPYLYVAEKIKEYDAYAHPLTAHQENTGATKASNSAFRKSESHTWWAAQWSQNYNAGINFSIPKDYWDNGQNKPVVLYEGKYCYLWTKDFGARVQGWMAYLNGMYGASWGGQDTWCYGSTYNEDANSSDGVDTITSEDKKASTWRDALNYKSTYQLSYMRTFFEDIVGDWNNLIPRFDDSDCFTPTDSNVYYICASENNKQKAVVYFYNSSELLLAEKPNSTEENAKKTGVLGGLDANCAYNYIWFDPVNGQIYSSGSLTSDKDGKITVPEKITRDMVFYVCKADSSCAHVNKTEYAARESNCEFYGHGAYIFCNDCNKVISGSSTVTALTSHTAGAAATCTNNQVCTVCSIILAKRLGHSYESAVTSPTCTDTGSIAYNCTRCDNHYTDTVSALGHSDCETVKIAFENRNYIVSNNTGTDTPFKYLTFSGDTCKVKFYVYNNTNKTLNSVHLAYNWGYHSYHVGDYTNKISGTSVNVSIAPQSGKTVEITVPRECVISNKEGSATDGLNDSLGKAVSYKEMGLRFTFAGSENDSASGAIYVTCIDAENGYCGAVTQAIAKTGYFSNNTVTLISGKNNIDASVRDTVVSDLIDAGYCAGEDESEQCVRCRKVFSEFNLDVGSTLDMNWYATFESETTAQSATVKIIDGNTEKNQIKGVATGKEINGKAEYKFTFADVLPQNMAKNYTAELWVNGIKTGSRSESIKDYCKTVIESDASSATKTFVADMLVYGQAFSDYKGLGEEIVAKTDTWIIDNASDFDKIKSSLTSLRNVTEVTDKNNEITSAGLYFMDINKIYFRATVDGESELKINGETVQQTDGKYYTQGIKATEFGKKYTVTVEKNGKELHKIEYNVNGYILAKCDSTGKIKNLARALGCYGYSANKLKEAK